MPDINRGQVLWDELMLLVREDDGLPVFPSKGMWTAKKLYFVCQYLEQTTRGMKNRRNFPSGLTYIDLFAGTGVSAIQPEGEPLRRYPGSPLIAASMPNPFDRLILVDVEESHISALQSRIGKTAFKGYVHLVRADCNDEIDRVLPLIPSDSLSIAFIDPYSLDVKLETVRKLAMGRAIDLIILFSDRFDLGRNVHKYYYPREANVETKLDAFLGDCDWRGRLDRLDDQSGAKVRALFADIYIEQLGTLGYTHAHSWPLEGRNGPVFRLVYASKNPLGLKFCEIALKQDLEGNRGLFSPG